MNFLIENLFHILKGLFKSSEDLLPLHGCRVSMQHHCILQLARGLWWVSIVWSFS